MLSEKWVPAVTALAEVLTSHTIIYHNIRLVLQLKDIVHENLNVFVGACVDPPNLCLLWHYCSKGSLNVSSTTSTLFCLAVLSWTAPPTFKSVSNSSFTETYYFWRITQNSTKMCGIRRTQAWKFIDIIIWILRLVRIIFHIFVYSYSFKRKNSQVTRM